MFFTMLHKLHNWLKARPKFIHLCWLFEYFGLPVPPYFIGGVKESIKQHSFVFSEKGNYSDPDDASHTWESIEANVARYRDDKLAIRFGVAAYSGWGQGNVDHRLYYNTTDSPTGATQVTTSSNVFRIVNDPEDVIVNNAAIDTRRCNSPSPSTVYGWLDGRYKDASNSNTVDLDDEDTELEWHVEVRSDAVLGQTYYFFVKWYDGSLHDYDTYSEVPELTVIGVYTKAITADAILKATSTKPITADGILKATFTKDITADAILEAGAETYYKYVTADAILKATSTKDITADAILQATFTKAITADAILKKVGTIAVTADAILKATFTKDITADALLQNTFTKAITADAILVYQFTKAITADAILQKTTLLSITADAILTGGIPLAKICVESINVMPLLQADTIARGLLETADVDVGPLLDATMQPAPALFTGNLYVPAWMLPASWYDPDSKWFNEDYIIDGSWESNGYITGTDDDHWLYLYLPTTIKCGRFRWKASIAVAITILIQVYDLDTAAWQTIYSGDDTDGAIVEETFTRRRFNQVRASIVDPVMGTFSLYGVEFERPFEIGLNNQNIQPLIGGDIGPHVCE